MGQPPVEHSASAESAVDEDDELDRAIAVPKGHDERSCQALIPVFALLGKRWTGLIISTLLSGPARFSELSRIVQGVSERMLADRLNELVSAGLVEREVSEGPPISVTYQLTPSGEGLRPALEALEQWAGDHLRPKTSDGSDADPATTPA